MLATTANFSNFTTSSPTSGFEHEANALVNKVLTTVSATLSLLGTLLIIGTFIAWKDFRSTSRRILVYISIADFFIAGGNLFGVWRRHEGSDHLCVAQSFVTTTACLWSFFWTTFLAAFMYITVAKKQRNKAEILLKIFHAFGWGIPLVIVGTALGLKKLGNDKDFFSSGWCWIDSKLESQNKLLWMLITGKAWEIAAYIICSIFYLMLKGHIRKEVYRHQNQFPSQISKEAALKMERKLTLVPVIFILVRIWGTTRFILYVSSPGRGMHKWEEVLLHLQGIGDSFQGFANFLLFCLFTEKFQARLGVAGHNLRVLCKKQKSDNSSSVADSTSVTDSQSQRTMVNERTRLLKSA